MTAVSEWTWYQLTWHVVAISPFLLFDYQLVFFCLVMKECNAVVNWLKVIFFKPGMHAMHDCKMLH